MQIKLVLDAAEFKKLPVAAKLAGCQIKEVFKAGSEIHAEVTAKDGANFVKLGEYKATLTTEEITAFEKREAEKKEKKATSKPASGGK